MLSDYIASLKFLKFLIVILITYKFVIKTICNVFDSSIFIDVVYFYDEYDKILTVEVNTQKPNFRRLRRFYIYVYVSSRLTEGKKLERTYVRQVWMHSKIEACQGVLLASFECLGRRSISALMLWKMYCVIFSKF